MDKQMGRRLFLCAITLNLALAPGLFANSSTQNEHDDLALHFNPRFHDDTDGAVVVCNSKAAGCWGDEKREIHNPLKRGEDVKIVLKLAGDVFEVELPDGQEIQFPNRENMDVISYIRITGDLQLTSFKIC
ncbi:hypothetical protein ABVT39_006092 [Epinephelus coioides]